MLVKGHLSPRKSIQQLTPQPSPVLQQHVTFSQGFNSSPAKSLSHKTKIPAAQQIHSSNGSLPLTQQSSQSPQFSQSPQSPRLLSRQINDTVNNNIMNDSSTPANIIEANLVSSTNQICIPKRTRSNLVSPVLQETNTNSNEELTMKTVRVLPTFSESQYSSTSNSFIKLPSSPPSSIMSSSIPILKTAIRDSSVSKKNPPVNRSTSLAYNNESTSLFDHNNSTNNHNVTANVMNHNVSNNGDASNSIKNEENQIISGRITNYNDANVMKRNGENVNTSSDDNGMNHINNGVINQIDERTEMIQTNMNRINFINNNMNGNSGENGDQLVSTPQTFSQSQSSPQPQQRQNINSATISARQIRSLSLGPKVINSLNRGGDGLAETDLYEHSVPEVPPPPYSPPESSLRFHRRRSSTSFFLRPKTSTELRKELLKLTEESKKEQDNWRIEEARLRMRINSKPEEIERVKRKMRESNEKYRKKIEAVTAKLRQMNFNNGDGN
ncbi:14051_t:CDS:2 [Dentiscutata heterogama]|uniref:14051_t:CDS:1 n=1 Tax=Dentiscutata heterogama TaxID=1316150 RepID=A0ACA9JWV5_9GLOM|nr:14051_t:CDS:2 [Dentiscutata heterogama]